MFVLETALAKPTYGFSKVTGVGSSSSLGSSLLFGSVSVPSVESSVTGVPVGLFAVPTAVLLKFKILLSPFKSTETVKLIVLVSPTAKVPELRRFVSPAPLYPPLAVKPAPAIGVLTVNVAEPIPKVAFKSSVALRLLKATLPKFSKVTV